MKKIMYTVALLLSLSITIMSCMPDNPQATTQTSSSGAKTVKIAAQFRIPVNSKGNTTEQQQILDQKVVTSDPSKILWMHLLTLDGHMYLRTPVRCKITSSGKRLEPTSCAAQGYGGQYTYQLGIKLPNGQYTSELQQIDGTFGQSDAYVYWFDPMGHYFQLGAGYLLSDMPIDIKNPTDAIGLYIMDKAASEWQKTQEAILKKAN